MFSMSDIQKYKYIESKRMAKDMHANSNHERVVVAIRQQILLEAKKYNLSCWKGQYSRKK